MTMQTPAEKKDKESAFVDYIIRRCQQDNGARSQLSRADNPSTEYQSWDILAGFSVRLDWEDQRLPYALIAAAIARGKVEKNGSLGFGSAIARCYTDGNQSEQAKMKLRRLLACDTTAEACRIMRPLMSLMFSRGMTHLDYAALLKDLLFFHFDTNQSRIKSRWAQDFYGKPEKQEGSAHE
jgi:CRISPR system Cascade subunit CasB